MTNQEPQGEPPDAADEALAKSPAGDALRKLAETIESAPFDFEAVEVFDMTNQGEPRVVSLGGKQYSGEPLATAGEWRVELDDDGYMKVATNGTVRIANVGEAVAELNNAASRLRTAVDALEAAIARHTILTTGRCTECGLRDGCAPGCEVGEWRNALKKVRDT